MPTWEEALPYQVHLQTGSMLPAVDHIRHTHDLARNAFAKGEPEHGAELADDLERLVTLHDASTIAAVIVEPVGEPGRRERYRADQYQWVVRACLQLALCHDRQRRPRRLRDVADQRRGGALHLCRAVIRHDHGGGRLAITDERHISGGVRADENRYEQTDHQQPHVRAPLKAFIEPLVVRHTW